MVLLYYEIQIHVMIILLTEKRRTPTKSSLIVYCSLYLMFRLRGWIRMEGDTYIAENVLLSVATYRAVLSLLDSIMCCLLAL